MNISGVSLLTFLTYSLLSASHVSGSTESEISELETEVAKAQNERDQIFLSPTAGAKDSSLPAKEQILTEKKNALAKRMREANTRATSKPVFRNPVGSDGENSSEGFSTEAVDRPIVSAPTVHDSPRDSSTHAPETALSGENIKGEITYPKKSPKHLVIRKAPDVSSENSEVLPTTISESGQSEITYPKKKTPITK
ncbi:MAG: hypothetical protein H7301_10000 [Cryobacterium sp.]|nr:hypothetical protein [Oligoflexia bacterium]